MLAHIWTESGMRGVPAMSKALIKSPQVKSPHECAFPYPRRKDGAWACQAPSKSPKGSQSCQGRVRKCRLSPEAGTDFRPLKAHVRAQKAVKAVQGRVRKCRRARQMSAETALTAHDLTDQVLLDGKLFDEGAFPSPRGRDVFSASKSAHQEPKQQAKLSKEGSENAAVPGRFPRRRR